LNKKIVKDESELKNLLEFSEMLNFYKNSFSIHLKDERGEKCKDVYNIEKLENFLLNKNYHDYSNTMDNIDRQNLNYLTKEKIFNINEKYKNDLQYPFNILVEYASSCYKTLELEEEIEKQTKKIEDVKFIFV
jgi:hypothetical protein